MTGAGLDALLIAVTALLTAALVRGLPWLRAMLAHRRTLRRLAVEERRHEREDSQEIVLESARITAEQAMRFVERSRDHYEGALREIGRLREEVGALRSEVVLLRKDNAGLHRENERQRLHIAELQRTLLNDYGRRISTPLPPPDDSAAGNGGTE